MKTLRGSREGVSWLWRDYAKPTVPVKRYYAPGTIGNAHATAATWPHGMKSREMPTSCESEIQFHSSHDATTTQRRAILQKRTVLAGLGIGQVHPFDINVPAQRAT